MVEYREGVLDGTYHAISHVARREIVERVSSGPARISDLAASRDISFEAVSKHVRVLEEAGLLSRSIKGREHWLTLDPSRLRPASAWLETYRTFWETSLDRLEEQLKKRPR